MVETTAYNLPATWFLTMPAGYTVPLKREALVSMEQHSV